MGFFRKVAGAFVELPDRPRDPVSEPTADDVSALLDQLGSPTAEPVAPPPPPAAPAPEVDALAIGPDEVFRGAGIEDSPNSALRLTNILAGLAMFPPEQQLAMVRALDAADASWSESAVLADARARQAALRSHVDGVDREHARRHADIGHRVQEAQAQGDAVVADIDAQIAELQQLRHEALTQTAQAIASLEAERREVDQARERAKKAVAEMSARMSGLVEFFAGNKGAGSA